MTGDISKPGKIQDKYVRDFKTADYFQAVSKNSLHEGLKHYP
jgi:hypothetical protein